MDVRLTDEQAMLQQVATAIAADLAPAGVDALRADDAPRRWAALADAGLLALPATSGATVVDAALVAEQLAGALAVVPFVGAGVWVPALLAAAEADDVVATVASGERRIAPVLRADLSSLAGLDGGVAFDAEGADAGLVLDDRGQLHLAALGEPTDGVDLTRTLRRVAPGGGEPVGAPLDADARQRVDAVALAVLAADLVGVAQRSLDEAVAYVRDREQFGVPVGSFQAVQHLAAHAAVLVEGARSSMWHAAWAADELDPPDALLAARQAKAWCSAAARDVGELTIQLFGGIGLTWEHLAHVRQRRILLTRRVLGDESAQYAAIADVRLGRA